MNFICILTLLSSIEYKSLASATSLKLRSRKYSKVRSTTESIQRIKLSNIEKYDIVLLSQKAKKLANCSDCSSPRNGTSITSNNNDASSTSELSNTETSGSYIASQSAGFVAGLTVFSIAFIGYMCWEKCSSYKDNEKKNDVIADEGSSLPRIDEDLAEEDEDVYQLQQIVEVIEDDEHQNSQRDRLGVPKVITPGKTSRRRAEDDECATLPHQGTRLSFNHVSSITCSEAYIEV